MTFDRAKDQIKSTPLQDVLRIRYGMTPGRGGMMRCCFHQDKTPSMKIWRDGFKCFGCGAAGDAVAFVQLHDGLTFPDAVRALAGDLNITIDGPEKKPNTQQKLAAYHREKDRERTQTRKAAWDDNRDRLQTKITRLRWIKENAKPLSWAWTYAYNKLQVLLLEYEELTGSMPN